MVHILTHPYLGNFGGGLQAYALQQTVTKLGFESNIIEYIPSHIQKAYFRSLFRNIYELSKACAKLVLNKDVHNTPCIRFATVKHFKKHFLKLNNTSNVKPDDSFIVGSDQVWRAVYARMLGGVPKYFLDFATPKQRQRSFAYAASFGTDEWEGSSEETEECIQLIRDFKSVSVRETSGIQLCKDIFSRDATRMPDPTMLLQASEYSNLINSSRTRLPKQPYIAKYILDETPDIRYIIEKTAKSQKLFVQNLLPNGKAKKIADRFPISIPQWLRYIRDAEYVVTDSFHGCVFCIIFNKPFVCIGNESRGNSRFATLMNTFDLQKRLISAPTTKKLEHLISTNIDWENVNATLKSEQKKGINYILTNLSQHE